MTILMMYRDIYGRYFVSDEVALDNLFTYSKHLFIKLLLPLVADIEHTKLSPYPQLIYSIIYL